MDLLNRMVTSLDELEHIEDIHDQLVELNAYIGQITELADQVSGVREDIADGQEDHAGLATECDEFPDLECPPDR